MKTFIGLGLILLGFVSISRYPDLGLDFADTLGALIGLAIIIVPGILLIRSDIKNKK